MQNHDEFDDGPSDLKAAVTSIFGALDRRDRIAPRGPVWAVAIVASLVIFLGSVLWYSYPREAEKRELISVPIIRADAGPYKVVPNDPGGMDIPHRDSTIFDTLHASRGNNGGERQVENLLPDSEEPMTREQIFAGLKTELKVEGKEIIKIRTDDTVPVDITEPVATAKAVEAVYEKQTEEPEMTIVASTTAMPAPQRKPDTIEAQQYSRAEPAAGVETYETSSGNHFVQFASLRSEQAAEESWNDLKKSLSFLRPLEHRVQRADLGSRGIYYRLQAGPFTETRAREICKQVEAQRPGGCLVVKN